MIHAKPPRVAKKNSPLAKRLTPADKLPRRGHFFGAQSPKKPSYFLAQKCLFGSKQPPLTVGAPMASLILQDFESEPRP